MHTAIAWFTKNPVAANLLMFVLIVGGIMSLYTVHQEEFPSMDIRMVTVSVPYLGAAPEEVEQGVCIRIEEALKGTDGIEKIQSTASEGNCSVIAMLFDDANEIDVLNNIKSQVDGINTFPRETEKPITSKVTLKQGVLQIALAGNADERTLKEIGKEIRDDIAAIDGISTVSLEFVRPYEISIEVSEDSLRRYGLTLEQVSHVIRNTSLDMPGGTLKTEGGDILLRAKGQAYWGEEFENIVVLTRNDGTKVFLSEIATIRDAFEEGDLTARFNGAAAAIIKVDRVGKEDAIDMATNVFAYIDAHQPSLPPGLELTVWQNEAAGLQERLDTLNSTAIGGLLLVVLILALFLKFRLAMWVAAGIPIALLGTIAVFPYADISMSTMTVLAFILVLGILVDDAIVVGERVYGHEQMGKPPIQAAIDGTWEVSVPVIFGVLTTMAAFLPLLLASGRMGGFFSVIGHVVVIALVLSIIESQLILPSHLAHRNHNEATTGFSKRWNNIQGKLAGWLENIANNHYKPMLTKAVDNRYITASIGLGVLILALALIASGRVVFTFFPAIEGDRVYATLEMPEGVAVETTARAAAQLEAAGRALQADLEEHTGNPETIANVLTSIGQAAQRGNGPPRAGGPGRSHFAEVVIELVPRTERNNFHSNVAAQMWREKVGNIPDAVKLSFSSDEYSAGEPINYELSARDVDTIREAATDLRAELGRYDGVFDITDSFRAGKQEIKLSLLPEARNLGLTLSDLASQVRSAFYGNEAQRIQRGQDDVRVMVRYPEIERSSIGNLEDMYIRTPQGTEVPFYSVAQFELGRGYSTINRTDGRRVINVIADVDRAAVSPEEINASIQQQVLPQLRAKYPGLTVKVAGEQEERAKSFTSLFQAAILSLIIIYALLAIPLRSYIQPLVIMSVIPFGAVGAITGHWIMGYELMFFSALGIVALSGVVVNASLVLVDYINRRRREGMDLDEAVLSAGVVRFRPIMLTSVTTFVGLLPLMGNPSPDTMPFIPMAISLAFGVLFATFITLLLVPSLYRMAEDIFGWDPVAQGQIDPDEAHKLHPKGMRQPV
ncbi:MAG: efflux RND transporter permease subunit [Gammaproteobacteria bacterium]|jgi:multidrug efflux pump subunit AcrB|nr:MAG: efflux RND transporter permease subunit [Gammaproteobacteria bacterium]